MRTSTLIVLEIRLNSSETIPINQTGFNTNPKGERFRLTDQIFDKFVLMAIKTLKKVSFLRVIEIGTKNKFLVEVHLMFGGVLVANRY